MKQSMLSMTPARYSAALIHHLEAQGVSCKSALRKAGVSLALLDSANTVLPREHVNSLIKELIRLTGRTDLGFEVGLLTNLSTLGVVGPVLLSSPDLAGALERVSTYFSLVMPGYAMKYSKEEGMHVLRCYPDLPIPYDVSMVALESITVSFHRLLTFSMQSEGVAYSTEVSWPAPPHLARYKTLKGVRFRFAKGNRPGITIRIPDALARRPFQMADARVSAQAEAACREMLSTLTASGTWADWVSTMLRAVDGSQPTHEEIAAMMNISARSLVRYLAAEGTTYRALALSVRSARACELLRTTSLSLADIAFRLGYCDVANFSRAFKAANGISPGTYRTTA